MKTTARALGRALYGVFACFLVGGAAVAVTTVPSVGTSTGNHLDSHPETNAALTAAAQQPGPQAPAAVKKYFDANAQADKDLQSLQQPLQSLSGGCKLPITLPQILQLMQAAQNGQPALAGPSLAPGFFRIGSPQGKKVRTNSA